MDINYMQETDPETAMFITQRMVKELKRFKQTKPFHSSKSCEDLAACVWHEGN